MLVLFAMACGTGAVIAVGGEGGTSSLSAAQSQYKPPGPPPGKPPGPPPGKPPGPPPGHGPPFIDSFFDVFFELPPPRIPENPPPPNPPRPPVPSIDKRFPPPGGPGFSPERNQRYNYFLAPGNADPGNRGG